MYRQLIYPLFARLDAERAHEFVLRGLGVVERASLARRLVALLAVHDQRLAVDVCGLRFPNPIGIAAGLDKNAIAVQTWGALGWGHVEVGTVTPQPQPGNAQPRIFRLQHDGALINRMGFPGQGAIAVHDRLQRLRQSRPLVGVNIGANKVSVDAGRAADDYVRALQQLYAVADYITINISSPNTARLRDLQGRAALDALVGAVIAQRDAMTSRKPLLVKIAPDLTLPELDDIVRVCVDRGVDGIIATNTTIDRPATLRGVSRSETGGLSGRPLRDRSTEIIRHISRGTGGAIPIIGVGGVFNSGDVWEKLQAGARLVQVYTGLIYEGPLLARRINRGLLRLMDQHGVRSVREWR